MSATDRPERRDQIEAWIDQWRDGDYSLTELLDRIEMNYPMNESEAQTWFVSGWRAAGEAVARLHVPDGFERTWCRTCDEAWPCATLQAIAYGKRAGYWLAGNDLINAADACSSVVSEFEGARGWEQVVEEARALEINLREAMKLAETE